MVKKDRVQISVEVDGKQGINELGKLEMEAKDLRASLKDLKKGTEEYNQANEKLKTATAEMGRMREQMGLAGMTMRQLTSYQRDLQREWNGLTKGTKAYADVDDKLKKVNATINQQRAELKGTAGVWGFLKSEIGKFGALAVAALGFDAIIGKINNLISRSAKLSDAMANLRMTTGLTAEAADQYNKSLSSLNTRTSREDLLGIGKIAGQFGVAKEELLDFTKEMNKVSVVLSSEFDGGAEQITEKMATLRNVFTDIKTSNISEDISNISNAVVVLAQEGVATAPVVTDFANRIGGVGINLGLTTPQVLGLSASMQELGITAERGGTATGKILQKMTTNTAEFAKVAGMDLKSFSKLVNEDIYSAFLKVLEGSKKGGEGAIVLGRLIKDLEISGAGASEVFSKLGNNMDLLANRTGMAGKAIKETSAITEQYNLKNDNFAGNLERIQKVIASWLTSGSVIDTVQTFVGWLAKLSEVKFSESLIQEQGELNVLVSAITSVNDEYGTRKRLLEELQSKYPDFLANLDIEKVTNEQLQAQLGLVNKEYMRKILLKQNEEAMLEFAQKEISLMKQLANQQKEMNKEKGNIRVTGGGEVRNISDDIRISIVSTKAALAELKQERADFMKEQQAMMAQMGDLGFDIAVDGSGKVTKGAPKTGNASAGESEEEKKAREKRESAQADAREKLAKHLAEMEELVRTSELKREATFSERIDRELALVDLEYREKKKKVTGYLNEALNDENLSKADKLKARNQFNADVELLDAQWAQARQTREALLREEELIKRQEIMDRIAAISGTAQENEIEREKQKFEKIISEAEKMGMEVTWIYDLMYSRIKEIERGHYEQQLTRDRKAKAQMRQNEFDLQQARLEANAAVTGGIINLLGAVMGAAFQYSAAGKIFALAELAFSTAKGLGYAAESGAKAEAQTPSFGARGTTQMLSTIAIVLNGMAGAARIISAQAPSVPNLSGPGGGGGGNGVPDNTMIPTGYPSGFYYGGETGRGPGAGRDRFGNIRGVVHEDEYVAPVFVRHLPNVINAIGIIEAERQKAMGYTSNSTLTGSGMSRISSTGGDDVNAMFEMVMMAIEKQGSRPVVFYANEFEVFQKEQSKIKYISQR